MVRLSGGPNLDNYMKVNKQLCHKYEKKEKKSINPELIERHYNTHARKAQAKCAIYNSLIYKM